MDETYGVWCEVSGGFTGNRQGWLKINEQRFEGSEAEAIAKAAECLEVFKGSRSPATFRYTARRV